MSRSPDPSPKPLDVVELAVTSGRWKPGTLGTVIERKGDTVLVEIDDERGHTLEFVSLPTTAVTPVDRSSQQHLPV